MTYELNRPWVFDYGLQVVDPHHIILAVPDLGSCEVDEQVLVDQLEELAHDGFFKEG